MTTKDTTLSLDGTHIRDICEGQCDYMGANLTWYLMLCVLEILTWTVDGMEF